MGLWLGLGVRVKVSTRVRVRANVWVSSTCPKLHVSCHCFYLQSPVSHTRPISLGIGS